MAAVFVAVIWAGRFRGPVGAADAGHPLLALAAPVDRASACAGSRWRYAVAAALFVAGLGGLTRFGLATPGVVGCSSSRSRRRRARARRRGRAGVAVGAGALVARTDWGLLLPRRYTMRCALALHAVAAPALRQHLDPRGVGDDRDLRTARLTFAPTGAAFASGATATGASGPRARAARRAGAPAPAVVAAHRGRPGLLGSGGARVGVSQPAAPGIAGALALVPLYLGYGAWAEGLRLQADNIGTPSLIGSGPLEEAGAHLVVPTVLSTAVLGGAYAVAVALSARAVDVGALASIGVCSGRSPVATCLPPSGGARRSRPVRRASSPGISCRRSSCWSSARSCRWRSGPGPRRRPAWRSGSSPG